MYSDKLAMDVIESIEGYTVFSLAFATIVLQLHPSINTSENAVGLNGYILASWIIWGVFWLEPIEWIVKGLKSLGCSVGVKEEANRLIQDVMEEKQLEEEDPTELMYMSCPTRQTIVSELFPNARMKEVDSMTGEQLVKMLLGMKVKSPPIKMTKDGIAKARKKRRMAAKQATARSMA